MKSFAKHFSALAITVVLVFSFFGFRANLTERNPNLESFKTNDTIRAAPHKLIIKFKPAVRFTLSNNHVGIANIDEVLKKIDVYKIESFLSQRILSKKQPLTSAENDIARIVKVYYNGEDDPQKLSKEISTNTAVEYAEPYFIYPLNHTPNDPMFSQQFAMTLLKLPEAWDISTGDSTIIIGDVDTGIDWTHPDLSKNVYINRGEWGVNGELSNNGIDDDHDGKIDDYHGWDFVGSSDASPVPDNNPLDGVIGHGTMTAGCASAVTNNGNGIASPGYRTKILPVKTAGDNSAGISAGYDGILYAADMGCKVINCSWGGTGQYSQAMQDVINYAFAKGALVVASSGNNLLDNDYVPHYPSSLNHVLAVGSVESNGGASNWCTYGTSVHVYAPGNGVLTTTKGGSYTTEIGTSFSSPITAGIAALIYSIHPSWNPDQVAKQIRVTSDAFTKPPGYKYFGRVNAFKALSLNQTMSDVPGIQMSAFTSSTPAGTTFSDGGQTAHVSVILENVLAPTSASAIGTVEFDNNDLSCADPTIPVGVMQTFEKKSFSFDVTLSANPSVSEGYLPVRIKIQDGSYVDYVMGRIQIYLSDGWHTTLVFGLPTVSSISAADELNVWAVAHIASPVRDYCFRSANGGTTWYNATTATFSVTDGVYCIAAIDASKALVGTGPSDGSASVYRTANGGTSWSKTSVSSITGFVDFIHMFDSQNGILVGDPKNNVWGIAKTTNGGVTWTPIAKPLTAPASEAGWNNGYDCIGDKIWFGTNNNKIYKSTDRGDTWTSYALPDKNSVDISFRDELVGAARFSTQSSQGGNGLAVTTDGGATWKKITTLTYTAVARAIMEKNGSRLWMLMNNTAYVSTNLGVTWTQDPVPGAFGSIACSDSYTGSNFTDVYAGSDNVYKFHSIRLAAAVKNENALPKEFELRQNYPNPFGARMNSATTISYLLFKRSHVSLKVYDLLGRELLTLMDGMIEQGEHEIHFNASALPSGMYFYTINLDGKMMQRSMVIER